MYTFYINLEGQAQAKLLHRGTLLAESLFGLLQGQHRLLLCASVDYLIHRWLGPFFSRPLWVGHNDDSLRQPVIWLLFTPNGPLRSANSEFPLQLLNESILRVALVHNDWTHFTSQQSLSVHGMHVGGLLGATDN